MGNQSAVLSQPASEPHGRNRLGLSVAARNFGDVPIRESLQAIAKIGFDTCDNFDWRNPEVFSQYQALLKLSLRSLACVPESWSSTRSPASGW